MNRFPATVPGAVLLLLAGLALGACEPSRHTPVAIDQTTSATIVRTAAVPGPTSCVPDEAPSASEARETRQRNDGELRLTSFSESQSALVSSGAEPAYDRAPLHEPDGARYGDVGVPYPLPSVVIMDELPSALSSGSRSPAATTPLAPIPETSFGSSSGGQAGGTDEFSGSSFGP